MSRNRFDLSPTPTPIPRRPEPPSGLPEASCTLWNAIVSEYPVKHFRGANLLLLEQLCRAAAFVKECDEHIRKHGLLIQSGEASKANPAIQARASAWAEVRACCTKLRLSISGTLRAESAKARPSEKHAMRKPWEA